MLHGDCLDVMRDMPDGSVDLVVTDPPYLVNYRARDGRTIANDKNDQWLKPAFAEMHRVLKPDSYCVSFYGWNSVDQFMDAWREAGFQPVGHFVWTKPYHSSEGFTARQHESAYLLVKGHPTRPEHPPSDVLTWEYTGNPLHPTQKPVTAMTPLIEAYSRPGDIVLDPFAGSGTTAVAAHQLDRGYIAIEQVPEYYQSAHDRLEEARGLAPEPSQGTASLQRAHAEAKNQQNPWEKYGAGVPEHQRQEKDREPER